MNKRRRLSEMATAMPLEIMCDHQGLSGVDLLSFLVAFNTTNRFIVVEALAGCGKTALLAGLVERINDGDAVLLLSFTRQAVTVAKLRVGDGGMAAQTFDSLFYHAVKHCSAKADMGRRMLTDECTYEDFRDFSQDIREEDLEQFICKADARYHMGKIKYVLVDEAQDSPPQALAILEKFRNMGKTVIVTGDRHQAIFGFMRTESLFDQVPSHACILHRLTKTRRCCPEVVAYLNARFGVDMVSAYPPSMTPDAIETICVQTKYNATLGRLYAKCLFSYNAPMNVSVSEGGSHDTFWDAVYQEAARMYSLAPDKAREAVHDRQKVLEAQHRQWHVLPLTWRVPQLVFSTVYHFKGGECDVTIVADDVELDERTLESPELERMKYVAGSRARWGMVDMKQLAYHGHEQARHLLHRQLMKARERGSSDAATSFGPPPRISSISEIPASVFPLVASRKLDAWMAEIRRFALQARQLPSLDEGWVSKTPRPMLVGSLADILVGWMLEHKARQLAVPQIHVSCTEYKARATRDRQYVHLQRQGLVGEDIDRKLRRKLARMKIRAALARYLVAVQGWDPLRLLVLKGAHDKACLQSFMMCFSLSSLVSDQIDFATRVRLAHIVQNVERDGLPGILGQPDAWFSLNIQQPMPPNGSFFFRGAYDVLILDKRGGKHLVEVKTVKQVSPAHVLQAVLYTVVVDASLRGLKGSWWTYVYETNRNHLCTFDVAPLLRMLHEDGALLEDLGSTLYAKTVSTYYARTLGADTLQRLMC